MYKDKALVLDIKGNSLDDGPGIRSVVFFKGCPLSCSWCHNLESKKIVKEISYDITECIGCNSCRDICENGVFYGKKEILLNRENCTLCKKCIEACPSGALKSVGEEMGVDEILEIILKDKVFFDVSGGGVTLSGGEPTLNMDFSLKLLKSLKEHDIHTLIETCGFFDLNCFMKKIYPYIDTIYFDLKIFNRDDHEKHCGIGNEKILNNFRALFDQCKKDNKIIIPRTPLVPGITDTKENLNLIASFLKSVGVKKASLLEYNPMWVNKTGKIGENKKLFNDRMESFLDISDVENAKALYNQLGIVC